MSLFLTKLRIAGLPLASTSGIAVWGAHSGATFGKSLFATWPPMNMGRFVSEKRLYSEEEIKGWEPAAQLWYKSHRTNPQQSRALSLWFKQVRQAEQVDKEHLKSRKHLESMIVEKMPEFIHDKKSRSDIIRDLLDFARRYQQQPFLARRLVTLLTQMGFPHVDLSKVERPERIEKYFSASVAIILLVRKHAQADEVTQFYGSFASTSGTLKTFAQELARKAALDPSFVAPAKSALHAAIQNQHFLSLGERTSFL